jgi:acetolactate synthase-1/2/3 large subunit
MRTLTKWAARIEHPADAPRMVAEAFRKVTSDRPGPVSLEMCWDTMEKKSEVKLCEPIPANPPIPVDQDHVQQAAKMLEKSKKPMIVVGAGAIEAGKEIIELAETLQAPIVSFRGGRGIVSDDHDLGLTLVAGYNLWHDTDILLGIGTRPKAPYLRWPYRPEGLKLVRIDIDPVEMVRLKPDVGIVGDAGIVTRDLIKAVQKLLSGRPSRREEIIAAKTRADRDIQEIQPQMAYLEAIREVLPRDGFFVEEVSQIGFAAWFGFPVYRPRTYVTCGYQGTLGYGFPTSLGVKVANPDKAVVSVNGDGGFMYGVQELSTAVQYNIGVVTIIFNNSAYGNVRRDQVRRFKGRLICSDLVNPDFVRLAESFGMPGYQAKTPGELKRLLEKALGDRGPSLIEVPVETDSEATPWGLIYPDRPKDL